MTNEVPAADEQPAVYDAPVLIEVGRFDVVAKGQYSRSNSDDSDAGGYWE